MKHRVSQSENTGDLTFSKLRKLINPKCCISGCRHTSAISITDNYIVGKFYAMHLVNTVELPRSRRLVQLAKTVLKRPGSQITM